jgi:hypothetical protein
MRRFLHLLVVGLMAGGILCAVFLALWYALCFICMICRFIPSGQKLLDSFFDSSVGHVVGFYMYGGLYPALVLSIPLGLIYSFCIYSWRRRQT